MPLAWVSRSAPARGKVVVGFALAVAVLLVLAEAVLRLSPPSDLYPFLGDDSPQDGPFKPDEDFGVAYRNWDSFVRDAFVRGDELPACRPSEGDKLAACRHEGQPLWAMFGNSFVQAPGMLADTARCRLPAHLIFNTGKNELLEVRLAQIKLLLESGFKPDRLFFELMPTDLLLLGPHPLSTLHVTERGAITYRVETLSWLTRHSRLALAALVRCGLHRGNRDFNGKELTRRVDPVLRADLECLFTNLARITKEHGVPVTVLLIPSYHQVARGDRFAFQDTLAPLFRRLGLDVFDPRDAFLAYSDRDSLFIPDRHFSRAGNELLLSELLAHLRRQERDGGLVTRRGP